MSYIKEDIQNITAWNKQRPRRVELLFKGVEFEKKVESGEYVLLKKEHAEDLLETLDFFRNEVKRLSGGA